MNPNEARKWLKTNFGHLEINRSKPQREVTEQEFITVLKLLKYLPKDKPKDFLALEYFLYEGCRRFNRWFVPSPPSVPNYYQDTHLKFAQALKECERTPMNAPVFLIHSFRDNLYTRFSGKKFPLNENDIEELNLLRNDIDKIKLPQNDVKRIEAEREKEQIVRIINSMVNGNLTSELKTCLPYAIARGPLEVSLVWEDIDIIVNIDPYFNNPPQMLVQTTTPNVIRPAGTTRWQYGYTAISINFKALIDPSIETTPLQLPAMEVPIPTWPNGLKIAFEIIYQVTWMLRDDPKYVGTWIPSPCDLGDIESLIHLNGTQISYIRRAYPSMVFEVFQPSNNVHKIQLDSIKKMDWYKRCRVLANQYAHIGETREVIFWLNVGIESMLRMRMKEHITEEDIDLDLDKIDSSENSWNEARKTIEEKYPEIAEEINWPVNNKRPSLYQQIKYYCENIPNAPNHNLTKKHYSKVSQKRNNLFHGNDEVVISIEDIKKAFESYDWLDNNFHKVRTE